jgi:basic membrane protein A
MKRSLALVGVLVLLVAAGCGGGKKFSANTTTATTGGSKLKIGLVTDIGGLNDRGFNHLSYLGLQRAQSELGVQQRVFQAKSPQDYVPNLSTFARDGY